MFGYVANTDFDWYRMLRDRGPWDEVNFWQPSSQSDFKAVPPGAPFFFRLKSPHNAIAGFGYFVRKLLLPAWEAWEVFGEANGTPSLADLTRRIAKYRRGEPHDPHGHQWIGCLIVSTPVLFAPDEWVRQPEGWAPNIVQGKRIDLTSADGRRILEECAANAAQRLVGAELFEQDTGSRYGEPCLVRPRLGQGTFRFAVLDAYGACAVTSEHAHPVLEAAHIQPYGEGGRHEVSNGLLLRADLHRLFDKGYVTVTPEHRLLVSPRLRDEWSNGRQYYAMHGQPINLPSDEAHRPDTSVLAFHNASSGSRHDHRPGAMTNRIEMRIAGLPPKNEPDASADRARVKRLSNPRRFGSSRPLRLGAPAAGGRRAREMRRSCSPTSASHRGSRGSRSSTALPAPLRRRTT